MDVHLIGYGREPVDRLRVDFVVGDDELARLLEPEQFAAQLLHVAVTDSTRSGDVEINSPDGRVGRGHPYRIGHFEYRIRGFDAPAAPIERTQTVFGRIDDARTEIHDEYGIRRNGYLLLSEGCCNPGE